MSAFQRNLANSVASQSMNLFNTRNNWLSNYYQGDLDREQAARNAAQQARSGFIGNLMKTGGDALGFFAGGG